MGKAWKIASTANDQSEEQKRGHGQAQKEQRTFHFATLIDICQKFQKYKGWVVLQSDFVKDDSGSHAVSAEQGSSTSQMTAAKVMGVEARLPACAGQAADAVCFYPGQNGGCTQITENSQIGMSRHLDTSTSTHVAKILVEHRKPSFSL